MDRDEKTALRGNLKAGFLVAPKKYSFRSNRHEKNTLWPQNEGIVVVPLSEWTYSPLFR
jgi:hypothetical protein